jgi:alpha-beta hydrolase superfamily lysophospholipase
MAPPVVIVTEEEGRIGGSNVQDNRFPRGRGGSARVDPARAGRYATTCPSLARGAELLRAMKRARSQVGRLRVPTLVIHGGADALVPTAVSEPLAGVAGVERRVLPNLRHEVLNEPEGPEVVAAIVEWLRSHVRAAAD